MRYQGWADESNFPYFYVYIGNMNWQGMGDIRQGMGDIRQGMGDIRQGMGDIRHGMGDIRHGMGDIRHGMDVRPEGESIMNEPIEDQMMRNQNMNYRTGISS
jgi:hypothetical protein